MSRELSDAMTVSYSKDTAALAHLKREAHRIFCLWYSGQRTAAIDALVIHGSLQSAFLATLVGGAIMGPLNPAALSSFTEFQDRLAERIR